MVLFLPFHLPHCNSIHDQTPLTDGQRPLQHRRITGPAGVGGIIAAMDDELFVDGQGFGEERVGGQDGGDSHL